jgi:hypothetical protein
MRRGESQPGAETALGNLSLILNTRLQRSRRQPQSWGCRGEEAGAGVKGRKMGQPDSCGLQTLGSLTPRPRGAEELQGWPSKTFLTLIFWNLNYLHPISKLGLLGARSLKYFRAKGSPGKSWKLTHLEHGAFHNRWGPRARHLPYYVWIEVVLRPRDERKYKTCELDTPHPFFHSFILQLF